MPDLILGIMSGSSLDGLDMAVCTFDAGQDQIKWTLVDAVTIPYDGEWKEQLRHAVSLPGKQLMALDALYGEYIGEQAAQWISQHQVQPVLIASHGHTVFHEPSSRFTTQIGSGAYIVAKTGIDTVTSFRNSDVALGGQGAPFAPIADRDLFPGYAGYLNLGGIANISIHAETGWKAWDISPCCQVLNFLAEKMGMDYDVDGKMAGEGKPIDSVVHALMAHFPNQHGKAFSLSNEDVYRRWLLYIAEQKESIPDLMASVTEAIAQLISTHIGSHIASGSSILCTGGGVHHLTLMSRLNSIGSHQQLAFIKPDNRIIDYKESLLMAYLGYLYIHDFGFGIHEVTGASRNHIGGALFKSLR